MIIDPTHIFLSCCLNSRGKPQVSTEACVIDYRSSAAEAHCDILTHSTDCRRVRLVGVQIGLPVYLGLSTSSFFNGSLAVVFGGIAFLGSPVLWVRPAGPCFLLLLSFPLLFIKSSWNDCALCVCMYVYSCLSVLPIFLTFEQGDVNSANASHTKLYIPTIFHRISFPLWPNFLLTQFLTNHSSIRSYLHKINKMPSPNCNCPDKTVQTAHHLMQECSYGQKTTHQFSNLSPQLWFCSTT